MVQEKDTLLWLMVITTSLLSTASFARSSKEPQETGMDQWSDWEENHEM